MTASARLRVSASSGAAFSGGGSLESRALKAYWSYSSQVTSVRPIQNGLTVTGCCGPSSLERLGSESGLPIRYVPPGIGTIWKVTVEPGTASTYGFISPAVAAFSGSWAPAAQAMQAEVAIPPRARVHRCCKGRGTCGRLRGRGPEVRAAGEGPKMSATARALAAGLLGLLTAPAPAGVAADPQPPGRFEFREPHMGSEFTVLMYCADEAAARRASRAAFDRIAALDAALSDYDPQSELMRLCAGAGGPPVSVSADLFRVLDRSREFWARSGGAFDPTIAPVVRLWRRARRDGKLPDPEALARARSLVGFDRVRLDPEARTVQLLKPGMKLDLGGSPRGTLPARRSRP